MPGILGGDLPRTRPTTRSRKGSESTDTKPTNIPTSKSETEPGNGVEDSAAVGPVRETRRKGLKSAEPIQASVTSNLEKNGNQQVLQANIEDGQRRSLRPRSASEQTATADAHPSISDGSHTKSKESAYGSASDIRSATTSTSNRSELHKQPPKRKQNVNGEGKGSAHAATEPELAASVQRMAIGAIAEKEIETQRIPDTATTDEASAPEKNNEDTETEVIQQPGTSKTRKRKLVQGERKIGESVAKPKAVPKANTKRSEEVEVLSEHEKGNSGQGSNDSAIEFSVSNMIQFNSPSFLAGDGEKNINVLVLGYNLPLNLLETVRRNAQPGINFNLIVRQSLVPSSKDLRLPTQYAIDENCIHYVLIIFPCTNPVGLDEAAKEFSYIDGLFLARKRFTVVITRKNAVHEDSQISLGQLKAFAITMNKPCVNVYIDDPEAMAKSGKILYNHIKRLVCNPLM